jgi:hypothetical protein
MITLHTTYTPRQHIAGIPENNASQQHSHFTNDTHAAEQEYKWQ